MKEQLRINREEEKQRLLEEKNINDDHRKMLKMAAGLTTKVSFHSGSPRSSSPSVTDETIEAPAPSSRRPSNLTRANVKAAAAAAERKAQQAAGRKVSIDRGGANARGKPGVGGSKPGATDRLNLEDDDDDDDDPDMMSLDNSMMSSVGFRKLSDVNANANSSTVKTNHARK